MACMPVQPRCATWGLVGTTITVATLELPAFLRVVEALLEALALLFLGDEQAAFDDRRATLGEQRLEGVDVGVALLPHLLRNELADSRHQHILVMGPVEDADLSGAGHREVDTPEKVVGELLRGRRFERCYPRPLRIDAAEHVGNRSVLPGGVGALEHEQQRAPALGPA